MIGRQASYAYMSNTCLRDVKTESGRLANPSATCIAYYNLLLYLAAANESNKA